MAEAFPSEAEAKIFAKSKLGKLQDLAAGTLNPHLPKRVCGETSTGQFSKAFFGLGDRF
jgi:hypothetical protein